MITRTARIKCLVVGILHELETFSSTGWMEILEGNSKHLNSLFLLSLCAFFKLKLYFCL